MRVPLNAVVFVHGDCSEFTTFDKALVDVGVEIYYYVYDSIISEMNDIILQICTYFGTFSDADCCGILYNLHVWVCRIYRLEHFF